MSGSAANSTPADRPSILDETGLAALLDGLAKRGYRVVGPTVRDQAIVYDDIATPADLPRGWTHEQDAGRYRLTRRTDDALFGYAVGPHSWKQFFHPPALRLWHSVNDRDGVRVVAEPPPERPLALIGVRACELRAIAIQDRVLLEGPHVDAAYRARRAGCFIVAVNCGVAGGTCFCVSMNSGPKADSGFDLALTELDMRGRRTFLAVVGSDDGRTLLATLPHRAAAETEIAAAEALIARTAATMGREMRVDDVHDLLLDNLEHPRWDDVAARCLSCGNCTMICPTCFCTTVEDSSDLAGGGTARTRRWDSCFTLDFSYVHGGSVRGSARARYRQWMTHKLATWVDQFGSSGCVGCGRCITWCPVAIDITAEVRAIRDSAERAGGKR